MPEARLRPRSRPLFRAATPSILAAALLIGGAAVPASASTTDGGVAWTVQTADNDNGVGRGNFTYDAQPGAVISDAMVVVNTGTVALPLTVYAADAFTTPSGEIDVLVDGTVSEESGTWVAVDPATLELAPGQSAEVTFTISVPADARPGDHSAGIVTSLVGEDATQSLSVDRRLGTRINVRVAGDLTPAAAVSGVTASYTPSWNPFASGILTVSYALDNSGNTRLTGTETFTADGVFGLFGSASPTTQLAEVIPGSVIEVRHELPVLSIGRLSGAVTVTPQGVGLGAAAVDPIIVEYSIPAVPWSLLVLLVLVAGLGVVLTRWRRSRARGAEPTPAA